MTLTFESKELGFSEPHPVLSAETKEIKEFGTGAHVTCSKDFLGETAIVLILGKGGNSDD